MMAKRNTPRPGSRSSFTARSQTSLTSQPTLNGVPNVAYMRPELRAMLGLYQRILDCIGGSDAVKGTRIRQYLPQPNAADKSEENLERYAAYCERAVFYAVTFRTVRALVGQIFLRDPQHTLPDSFDAIILDANGEGVSLDQTAKLCSTHTISLGRGGLHVDYTTAPDTGATVADVAKGDVRPIIVEYPGNVVTNWRKAKRGTRMVYTLVVVMEDYTVGDDGFEARTATQYKVMRLVSPALVQKQLQATLDAQAYGDQYDNAVTEAISSAKDVYVIEVWRSDNGVAAGIGAAYAPTEIYYPKDYDGNFLDEIPFKFVGSEQNDDSIDQPPVGAMADINLAHFRNSADYEESVFLVGQPTPYVSGVTMEWNQQVLKGQIQLGSRGVIVLPAGGDAGLLQAEENTLAKGAMDQKERQMVALGAKLVEQREVQRTATEAEMESTADTSILANVASNVSAAMEWALKTACKFTGDDPDKVTYVLNKEFDLTKMPADARQQLLLEYQADMITFEEMRANLRRGGIATLDDATAKTQLAAQKAKRQADAVALAAATAIATKPTIPGSSPPPAGSTGNSPGNTRPAGAKPGSNNAPKPQGT